MRLAGQNTDRIYASREHHQVVWGSTSDDATHHWNVCTADKHTCPFSPGDAATWRRDGGAFAAYAFDGGIGIAAADGGCAAGAHGRGSPRVPGPVFAVERSAAVGRGRRDAGPRRRSCIWPAPTDPSSRPSRSPAVPRWGRRFSADGNGIYMGTFSESTSALSWFDLRSSPPVEQRLSSNYGQLAAGRQPARAVHRSLELAGRQRRGGDRSTSRRARVRCWRVRSPSWRRPATSTRRAATSRTRSAAAAHRRATGSG